MNLWDRLKMVLVVICLLSFVACEDPTELGKNIKDVKNIEVRYAEIPLEAGMVRVDSISTTNRGTLYVGEVNDPVFGVIKASSFTNISYRPSEKLGTDLVYDSLVLILNCSEFYSLGEQTEMGIEVRELTDSMLALTNYTTHSEAIPYASNVLGSISKTVSKQTTADTVRITLDKFWGSKIDFFLKNTNLPAKDDSLGQINFNQTVTNGLALLPTSQDGIVRINTLAGTSELRIYYHKDTVTSSYALDLNFTTLKAYHIKGFTKVETNRSASLLSMADTKEEFEFFNANDSKVYSSNITGILPVISMDNIYSFLDTIDRMVVNRADIILEATDNALVNRELKPANFLMYWTEDPIKIDYLKTVQSTGANPLSSSFPNFLAFKKDEIFYTDITSSVQGLFDRTLAYKSMTLSNTHRLSNDDYYYPYNNLSRLEIDNIKLGIYYTVLVNK